MVTLALLFGVGVGEGVGVTVGVGVGVGGGGATPLTHEYKSLFGEVVSFVVKTPFVAELIIAWATADGPAVGLFSK